MSWPVCHSMLTVAKIFIVFFFCYKIFIDFVQVVARKVEANLKLKSFYAVYSCYPLVSDK